MEQMTASAPIVGLFGQTPFCALCEARNPPKLTLVGGRTVCPDCEGKARRQHDEAMERERRERELFRLRRMDT